MSKSTASNEEPQVGKNEVTVATRCREFTESTTLHGIQNVFRTGSSKKRRILKRIAKNYMAGNGLIY